MRSASCAVAISGSSSATPVPGGFSSITCLPAASAAAAWARRTCGGVQSETASIGGPFSSRFLEVAKCGTPGSDALRLATAASVAPAVAAIAPDMLVARDLAEADDGNAKFGHAFSPISADGSASGLVAAHTVVNDINHRFRGGLGVAGGDAIDDLLVPEQHGVTVLRLDRCAEQEGGAQGGLDDVADRAHEQIARSARHRNMEREVGVGKADGIGSLKPHAVHATTELGEVVLGPLRRRQHGRARLDREANLGEVVEEALVDAGVQMPGQHVSVEHVPGGALAYDGADAGLGGEQTLGDQGLHALAQHRPRHAEHRNHLGITRQARSLGVAAGDDVDADRAGHFRMVGVSPARRDDDDARRHVAAPARFAAGRRASATSPCCKAMKANSSTPVAILVHQLDSVPSKLM